MHEKTWHPEPPVEVGEANHTTVWRFPCCNKAVAQDPEPARSPGCQPIPTDSVSDGGVWWRELPGGSMSGIDIECCRCGWRSDYIPRDTVPPSRCEQCGHDGSETPPLPNGDEEAAPRSLLANVRKNLRLPRLTTFRGWLRDHRPYQNNVWGEAAFAFFPRFLPPDWTDEAKAKALANASKLVKKLVFQPSQHRRFGGFDLSRGSYYSVCTDEFGNDSGTLAAELKAYRDRGDQNVFVDVYDGTRISPSYGSKLPESIQRAWRSCLVITIYPAERLRMVIEAGGPAQLNRMSDPQLMSYLRRDTVAKVVLMPNVSYHEIENVVDLRDPETRQSFYDVFRTGAMDLDAPTFFHRPFGDNISSFVEMIPELIDYNIGGAESGQGGLTQQIASYLRIGEVSALIYPSARADAFSEMCNGEPSKFGGWNLVDYRHSPRNTLIGNGIMVDPWVTTTVFDGIHLYAPTEGQFAGSFAVRGVEDANDKIYADSSTEERQRLVRELEEGRGVVLLFGSLNLDALWQT